MLKANLLEYARNSSTNPLKQVVWSVGAITKPNKPKGHSHTRQLLKILY